MAKPKTIETTAVEVSSVPSSEPARNSMTVNDLVQYARLLGETQGDADDSNTALFVEAYASARSGRLQVKGDACQTIVTNLMQARNEKRKFSVTGQAAKALSAGTIKKMTSNLRLAPKVAALAFVRDAWIDGALAMCSGGTGKGGVYERLLRVMAAQAKSDHELTPAEIDDTLVGKAKEGDTAVKILERMAKTVEKLVEDYFVDGKALAAAINAALEVEKAAESAE